MTVAELKPEKVYRLNHAFWFRLPVWVRRFQPKFSLFLTDGLYVSAWPQLGGMVPLVCLFIGFFTGALFLSPSSSEIPIYSSSLMLMWVLISISSLGSALGFWLFLGYILGDIFILRFVRAFGTPVQIGAHGLADAACLTILYGLLAVLLISVPFISYRLRQLGFLLPAELGKLAIKFLQKRGVKIPEFLNGIGNYFKTVKPAYKKWMRFPFDAVLYATFLGMLSYLWTQCTPILMRSAYVWYYSSPQEATVDVNLIAPLQNDYLVLVRAGMFFGVMRILLEYMASGQTTFLQESKKLSRALHEIKVRQTNVVIAWVGECIRIVLATLILYGILQDRFNVIVTAIVLFASSVIRKVVLPRLALWRDLIGNIPLILRIIGIGSGSYWLSGLMMEGKLSGSNFYPVLLPLWICLLLSTLFFPEQKQNRAPKITSPPNSMEGGNNT